MSMYFLEDGMHVLVIGGSYGVGYSIRNKLIQQGATVCTLGRSKPSDASSHDFTCDIESMASINQFIFKLLDVPYKFNAVVIAVGIKNPISFDWTDYAIEKAFATNAKGPAQVIKKLIEEELVQIPTKIVLISNVASYVGNANDCGFAMSKAAIETYLKCLELKYKDIKTEIVYIQYGDDLNVDFKPGCSLLKYEAIPDYVSNIIS